MVKIKYMAKTKLIIFDYDGVLLNTFTLVCHVYNHIFRHFKIEKNFSKKDFQNLFETDWRICLDRLGLKTEEQHNKCEKIFREVVADFADEVTIYPDIKFVLEQLKEKGYKMAVVSNNSATQIIKTLERNGILPYFDRIIDVSHSIKPSADGVNEILKEFNIKSEEAVMIGDMDGDIATARNAKLKKAIAVTYGYHHKDKLKKADVIIDSPLEILDHIE